MTPMIDVVFLLLIFFVCTASFEVVEHVLPSDILASGSTAAADVEPEETTLIDLTVRTNLVGNTLQWTVNEAPCASLQQVADRLRESHAIEPTIPVILVNGGRVPLEDVVAVYDLCRVVGFSRVQFAASAEP